MGKSKVKKNKKKTYKSLAKRVKVTGSGKIKRTKLRKRDNDHYRSKRRNNAKKSKPEKYVLETKTEVKKAKELLNV